MIIKDTAKLLWSGPKDTEQTDTVTWQLDTSTWTSGPRNLNMSYLSKAVKPAPSVSPERLPFAGLLPEYPNLDIRISQNLTWVKKTVRNSSDPNL